MTGHSYPLDKSNEFLALPRKVLISSYLGFIDVFNPDSVF